MGRGLFLALWAGLALAQGVEYHRDALHGYGVQLPQDYFPVVRDYGLLLGDLEAFLLVRGMPLRSPREGVAPLVREAVQFSGGRARYHFKGVPGGFLLLVQGLSYPFHLAGEMAPLLPPAYEDPFLLGLGYEAAHLLLPGTKSLLVLSAYLPQDASLEARRRFFAMLRSLEFLPPKERVPFALQTVRDPLLGVEAFYAKVPQGHAFQGGLVPVGVSPGAVRNLAFSLRGPQAELRRDFVALLSQGVQTGWAANASTVLLFNGQGGSLAGFLCPASPDEAAGFLGELWSQEGRPWQPRQVQAVGLPKGRVARRLLELQEAYEAAMTAGLPVAPPQRVKLAFSLEAASGGLMRQAQVRVDGVVSQDARWPAATAYCDLRLEVLLREGTREALRQADPVFRGFQAGLRSHPEWPVREAFRAQGESKQATQRVLAMVRQQQEFNTWMRQSWANLLSDQTYVRDPSTGEVFRAYKASFDTGTFWRDPAFGGVVGAVERGGRLEEGLRQGGWRQLEESLSGLPGTWQR